jgi:hypothetical protein
VDIGARSTTMADDMNMDLALQTASLALSRGDPLGALRYVALRADAVALALRGIAMAQLGELARAKQLLQAAARAFGKQQVVARARCLVAQAEVALASRDLHFSQRSLLAAGKTLAAHGDARNARQAQLLAIRRLVLVGRCAEAGLALAGLPLRGAPPGQLAVAALIGADIALRGLRTQRAHSELARARRAAQQAGIPALQQEVAAVARALQLPAARLMVRGEVKSLTLAEVERYTRSAQLAVDACRRCVRRGEQVVSLQRRPVLFALARSLAEAWPASVPRDRLAEQLFGVSRVNESHRVRLRVEVARLRRLLEGLARVDADRQGFGLVLPRGDNVLLLLPPIDSQAAALRALLADGAAWSSSALALALGGSQRSVQRALLALAARGEVHSFGRARAQRWLARPSSDFATTLLLPAPSAFGSMA